MILARIEGSMVATACHSSMRGHRTVICQPLGDDGRPLGTHVLAVDPHGAGQHQLVLVSTDGATTRARVGDPRSPLRNLVVAIVDELS